MPAFLAPLLLRIAPWLLAAGIGAVAYFWIGALRSDLATAELIAAQNAEAASANRAALYDAQRRHAEAQAVIVAQREHEAELQEQLDERQRETVQDEPLPIYDRLSRHLDRLRSLGAASGANGAAADPAGSGDAAAAAHP